MTSTHDRSLLTALYELSRQAEGRRMEMKYLMIAIGILLDAMLKDLRQGDSALVDSRQYVVEVRDKNKVLAVNHGVLGPREIGKQTYASVEDNVAFANHARRVIDALAMSAGEQRQLLSGATQKALEAAGMTVQRKGESS